MAFSVLSPAHLTSFTCLVAIHYPLSLPPHPINLRLCHTNSHAHNFEHVQLPCQLQLQQARLLRPRIAILVFLYHYFYLSHFHLPAKRPCHSVCYKEGPSVVIPWVLVIVQVLANLVTVQGVLVLSEPSDHYLPSCCSATSVHCLHQAYACSECYTDAEEGTFLFFTQHIGKKPKTYLPVLKREMKAQWT